MRRVILSGSTSYSMRRVGEDELHLASAAVFVHFFIRRLQQIGMCTLDSHAGLWHRWRDGLLVRRVISLCKVD